ncbi:sigma-70 family RNA polymerase sigma factor [Streptomyces sp. NPDC005438]|uniref:RNA polymerase sigma factor n=1 Tax=Streptomyces sp. NPDC005438 TaxID=3156880 RepID=UPI0033A618BF
MEPFERVVAEYGALVLRVCRAVLGPQDAEDAWSETFLAALRAYPRLPWDADVRGWLVTIAHRKSVDVVRARARQALPVAQLPERTSHLGQPEDAVRDAALWDALRRLPDRQRRSVAYHYLAGLPYKEVARLIGVSPAAARRAAADGVRALRGVEALTDEAAGAERGST